MLELSANQSARLREHVTRPVQTGKAPARAAINPLHAAQARCDDGCTHHRRWRQWPAPAAALAIRRIGIERVDAVDVVAVVARVVSRHLDGGTRATMVVTHQTLRLLKTPVAFNGGAQGALAAMVACRCYRLFRHDGTPLR